MSAAFRRKFEFNKDRHLHLGVERECFFVKDGIISPLAPKFIPELPNNGLYGYELSACQLETRTKPHPVQMIGDALIDLRNMLEKDRVRLGFEVLHQEVAPFDMPLDIYPDPTGRYQKITKDMTVEKIRAACRVAGTHVHVGMGSPRQAIRAYNAAIKHIPELCAAGDKSNGERLKIYKIMAPNFQPPTYKNWGDFEKYANKNGFWKKPRNCWHIIRISTHGTIEFRMFGATPDVTEILAWAIRCHQICKDALL
ncbi:MAG: hypothetical protein KBC81_03005 [Candidatus Pacebacteria bacterium]|nr:hypothetical protein [Candidatus Paceibacterota bacterium]